MGYLFRCRPLRWLKLDRGFIVHELTPEATPFRPLCGLFEWVISEGAFSFLFEPG